MLTIPNRLTLSRILLIPFFVFLYYMPGSSSGLLAASIFILAGITDWLDGYLARRLEQSSSLGAFLDPVADKLLVATALVLLVSQPNLPYTALPAAVIIGREIVISALREWMAELGKRANVAVTYVGKIKTLLQFSAISILLICQSIQGAWLLILGYITLYAAAGLTLWSMVMYLQAAWPSLKADVQASGD